MQIYQVDEKKRKKSFEDQTKAGVKTGGFVRFCFFLTRFLIALAYILGVLNILYVIAVSKDGLDLIFLLLTFAMPMGLSLLPRTVYVMSASANYRFRRKETVAKTRNGFVYSYHDDRSKARLERLSYNVVFDQITKFEYDAKTAILTIYGDISEDVFIGSDLKETNLWSQLSLMNTYDIDLYELLKENC